MLAQQIKTTDKIMRNTELKRLEIYYVDLGIGNGSVQGGIRPCVIISNDKANKFSPVIHIAPITSKMMKKNMPTHVRVPSGAGGLPQNSIILVEQAMLINKNKLKESIGSFSQIIGKDIERAIMIQMGIIGVM